MLLQPLSIGFEHLRGSLAFLTMLSPILVPEGVQASPRYGLWVEAEGKNQPFRSKADFEAFLQFSSDYPFTDLYCQVYRGGRAWFRSSIADQSPYELARSQGFDPLADTIAEAKTRGQRVHAWLNILRVDRNFGAPILLKLGPKAVLTDNYGNSLLDYTEEGFPPGKIRSVFRLDTPGIWLDPSVLEVRQITAQLVSELVRNYPGLAGVHLDMIRFPFAQKHGESAGGPMLDFPFGEEAQKTLKKETGRAHVPREPKNEPSTEQFRDWRRSQITRVVFDIHNAVKRENPKVELSAAVIAWSDRSQTKVFQNWKAWLEQRIVDQVLLMNYSEDVSVARENSREATKGIDASRTLVGLGAWLHLGRPKSLIQQGSDGLATGAGGLVLFSYSNLFSTQGRALLKEFSEKLFRPTQEVHKDQVR